jgi:hypothetical protein
MSGAYWQARASRLREASDAVTFASRQRRMRHGSWDRAHPSFAEWEARVEAYWAAMRAAYPPDFWDAYMQLTAGDARGADLAIEFLEADPICFRSGYLKADFVRFLARIELTKDQLRRLRNVVLAVAETRDGREFRRYCALARKLDAPEFRERLERLARADSADIQRRAGWVLAALP